jgi:hypothetical protein
MPGFKIEVMKMDLYYEAARIVGLVAVAGAAYCLAYIAMDGSHQQTISGGRLKSLDEGLEAPAEVHALLGQDIKIAGAIAHDLHGGSS